MDILITKDHIGATGWVHAGASLLDVDPIRAADLMRNGLARPLVSLALRQQPEATADATATPKRGGKWKKPDVQTFAQTGANAAPVDAVGATPPVQVDDTPPPAVTEGAGEGDGGQNAAPPGGVGNGAD